MSPQFCQMTKGDWCKSFRNQELLPVKPPKRGDLDCPNKCSGVGNCDYDTGTCWCPAGYGGEDCSAPRKRPCWRMGEDKRDLGWTKYHEWSHSRCAGVCDDDIAMCYCPPETRHGHIAAPAGSPLGTPPIKVGRPLYWCHPSTDEKGNEIKWGAVKYPDLFGPNGWCNADISGFRCPCRIDGVVGEWCNIKVRPFRSTNLMIEETDCGNDTFSDPVGEMIHFLILWALSDPLGRWRCFAPISVRDMAIATWASASATRAGMVTIAPRGERV